MSKRGLKEAAVGAFAHGFAWIGHTEQIWFPMAGAYMRYLQPELAGLPDLRGPFLAITLAYIGLRIGDLLNEREELQETL